MLSFMLAVKTICCSIAFRGPRSKQQALVVWNAANLQRSPQA